MVRLGGCGASQRVLESIRPMVWVNVSIKNVGRFGKVRGDPLGAAKKENFINTMAAWGGQVAL